MSKNASSSIQCAVLDWGTTCFRAFLIDQDSKIVDQRSTEEGIQHIADGNYEQHLTAALADWFDKYGCFDIVLAGTITSRNGWVEVPYVNCPAGADAFAAGIVQKSLANGSRLLFVPGLTDPASAPYPDVMRGEEAQLIGYGLDEDAVLVLPGTHSKWARVNAGTISKFNSFVTGELYAVLSKHSFFARAADPSSEEVCWDSFAQGAQNAASSAKEIDAMLTVLFSARTGMLCGQIKAASIQDYTSGLLIGLEFRQAAKLGWHKAGDAIAIIGSDPLTERYARCCKYWELEILSSAENLSVAGCLLIRLSYLTLQ